MTISIEALRFLFSMASIIYWSVVPRVDPSTASLIQTTSEKRESGRFIRLLAH